MNGKHENFPGGGAEGGVQDLKAEIKGMTKPVLTELACGLADENEQLKSEIEDISDELSALREKYSRAEKIAEKAMEVNTLYQRLQSDFDNYRRRNQEIAVKAKEDAEIAVGLKFAPVMDNLLRALRSQKSQDSDGGALIARQFEKALSDIGLTRIESLGQPFNFDEHDAVTTIAVADSAQNDTVVDIISEGYRYGDRVVKHAQVVVGKYNG